MSLKMPLVSNKLVLSYLWKFFWRYPKLAIGTTLVTVIGASTQLVAPWFLKKIIDILASKEPSPEALVLLWPVLCGLITVYLVEFAAWRTHGWFFSRFQPLVMRDLEIMGFEHLLGHSYQFFSDSFTGTLVRRIRRLSQAYESMVDISQFQLLPAVLILVGALVTLSIRSPLLAIIFFGWSVLFFILIILGSRWKLELDVIRAEKDSNVTGALSDAVTNAVTIKLFANNDQEKMRFDKVAEELRSMRTRSWRRGEMIFTTQAGLMFLMHAGFLIISVRLWSARILTVGDIVLVQAYLHLVFDTLWNIGRAFRRIYEAIADAKEMVEILELPYGVKDRRGAKALTVPKGEILFKDVTFAFQSTRTILKNFSLKIAPKEKVALVGPSGAGKSTVTKLLLRMYDADGGKILIDGQNVALATQDSLHEQIALVPQEPVLFHRTLRENILYGRPDATEKELIAASKKAHCHEFISQLPDGYESYVGERGVKLSGGERQRVAIARAIIKNAPILILDEATSSLDSESESYIQEALRELMKKKTVIVIAHRLSTIMEMDRIVVVEDGRVADTGTHQELIAKEGTYKRLWEIQAGGFIAGEDDEGVSTSTKDADIDDES